MIIIMIIIIIWIHLVSVDIKFCLLTFVYLRCIVLQTTNVIWTETKYTHSTVI